ncbi:hypothetical protein ABK040_003351 [Willaertia magna]
MNLQLEIIDYQIETLNDDKFINYIISCSYKGCKENTVIIKRYSEILYLHQNLILINKNLKNLNFPKKILFGNFKEENILKRKKELQNYFENLLNNPIILQDLQCCQFIYSFFRKSIKRTTNDQIFGKYLNIVKEKKNLQNSLQNTKFSNDQPKGMWFLNLESLNIKNINNENILQKDWNKILMNFCNEFLQYNKMIQYPRMMMYKECCEMFENFPKEREISILQNLKSLQKLQKENEECYLCLRNCTLHCFEMLNIFEKISEKFIEIKNCLIEKNFVKLLNLLNLLENDINLGKDKIEQLKQIIKTTRILFEEFIMMNFILENKEIIKIDDNYLKIKKYINYYLLPLSILGYLSELSFLTPDTLNYFKMFNFIISDKFINKYNLQKFNFPNFETRKAIANNFQLELQSISFLENGNLENNNILFSIPINLQKTNMLFTMRWLIYINNFLTNDEGFEMCKYIYSEITKSLNLELDHWNNMFESIKKLKSFINLEESSEINNFHLNYETKSKIELLAKNFSGYAERLNFYCNDVKRYINI